MSKESNKYLGVLFISRPMTGSNSCGETDGGNGSRLQFVTIGNNTYSVLNGPAIRYGIRNALQRMPEIKMWRKHTPDGYLYGKDSVRTMVEAKGEVADEAKAIQEYIDLLFFGYMIAAEGSGKNAVADGEEATEKGAAGKKTPKRRGLIQVSMGLSTSPFLGDTSFSLGTKAKDGELCPYTGQRHFTRYYFTVHFDLERLREEGLMDRLPIVLQCLRGLQVGGKQSANLAEVVPEALVWRFFDVPGQSGLWVSPTEVSWEPEKKLDLQRLFDSAADCGYTVNVAGNAVSGTSIDDGLKAITKALGKV